MNTKPLRRYLAFLLLGTAAISAQTITVSPDGPIETLVEAQTQRVHYAVLERPGPSLSASVLERIQVSYPNGQ